MSDSPKKLIKDKDKKRSFKKASSFSALLGRKDKEKRAIFEEELAKFGTSGFLLNKEEIFEGVKPEELLSYTKRGEDFSSEDSGEEDQEEDQLSQKEEEVEFNFDSDHSSEAEKVTQKMSFFGVSTSAPPADQADLEILSILRSISVEDVLKASTLDIMSKTSAERRDIVIAAVHCMCNGPVGVNKITNFPLISGERSIKSMIECSNRTWKAFCLHLINDLKFDCAQKCYTKDEFGFLWPVCESVMKLKAPP